MTTRITTSSKSGYYRHGETFWRDLIARQAHSGQGVRKFCFANGVAYSTFHKWRAELFDHGEIAAPSANVTTADAMFMPIFCDSDVVVPSPVAPPTPSPKSSARDSVILTSGGVRVELTGAHADRIVRHLLGRLGATSC